MGKIHAPRHYFLGANTADGFTSFYHEFLRPDDGAFLWYIKGGPGNGKSTLMRTLAGAAEKKGKTVEYAYCSGDPDSLDGIYIREDRLAYVDATSPHVQEPEAPGASGRYLDLSGCYRPGLEARTEEIREYFRRYRAQYAQSYALFQEAAASSAGAADSKNDMSLPAELIAPEAGYFLEHRFLSAWTCKGFVSLWDRIEAKNAGFLDDDAALFELLEECREKGCRCILCPDPITPQRVDGLILPEQGLVFRAERNPRDPALLSQAVSSLREAKRLHDELEALYRPYVDFSAVDAIIRQHLCQLG